MVLAVLVIEILFGNIFFSWYIDRKPARLEGENRMSEGRNAAGFIIVSFLISIFVFFMSKAFLEDIMGKYFAVAIENSVDIASLGSSWVLISTMLIMVSIFVAVLLSGIDRTKALFSLELSFITTILIMTTISYVALTVSYPFAFTTLTVFDVIGGFNFYNMMFAVYIVGSTDVYFFIVFAVLFGQTVLYLAIVKGFKKDQNFSKKSTEIRFKKVSFHARRSKQKWQ